VPLPLLVIIIKIVLGIFMIIVKTFSHFGLINKRLCRIIS
jgi:hypothetical protein